MKYDSKAKPLPNLSEVWSWVWAFHPKIFYFCGQCRNYIIPDKPSESCEECGANGKYLVLWIMDNSNGFERYKTLERQDTHIYTSPSKICLLAQTVCKGRIIVSSDIKEEMLNRLTDREVVNFGKWLNDRFGVGVPQLTRLTLNMFNNTLNDYIALGLPE